MMVSGCPPPDREPCTGVTVGGTVSRSVDSRGVVVVVMVVVVVAEMVVVVVVVDGVCTSRIQ